MKRIVRERCFKYYSKDVDKKNKKKTNSKPKIKLKSILKRNSFPVFFFVFFLTKCKHGFFSVYYRVTQFKRKTWCTRVICD